MGCIKNEYSRRCTPWLRRVATSTRYRVAQVGERWLRRTSRKRLATPVTCPCASTTFVVRLAIISFLIATRFMMDLIRGSNHFIGNASMAPFYSLIGNRHCLSYNYHLAYCFFKIFCILTTRSFFHVRSPPRSSF